MPEDDDKLSDEALFKAHVGHVTPIKSKPRVLPHREKPKPRLKRTHHPSMSDDPGATGLPPVSVMDRLFYAPSGLPTKTIKRLKQGRFSIDDEVDLHGLNQPEAKRYLHQFLDASWTHQHQCVLVIHGKGIHGEERWPILKNLAQTELMQHPHVLAFCSAHVKDGGLGAVYVLLKRHGRSSVDPE